MTYKVELGIQPEAFCFIHIAVEGETIEEVTYKLDTEFAQLANQAAAAYGTASAIVKLNQGGLQPTVESPAAPAAATPTKPWEKAATVAPATSDKPWQKAQAGAPMQAGNTAPVDDNTLRVEFGYMDADKFNEFRNFSAAFYTDHKNSFSKPKGEQYHRFYRKPTDAALSELMAGLEYFGGKVIAE